MEFYGYRVTYRAGYPKVAVAVLTDLLAPFITSGQLVLLTGYKITSADFSGEKIKAVKATGLLRNDSKVLTG